MKSPKLSLKILRDGDALAMAIERVLLRSRHYERRSRKVRRMQRRLHRVVGAEGWAAYLRLEEEVNWRDVVEGYLLVRWAYREGRRSRHS